VIYTSGSTGEPKGVAIPHAGALNIVATQRAALPAFRPRPGAAGRQRVLQYASPSFDASIYEMILALAHGGTLVVSSPAAPRTGTTFAAWLARRGITATLLPPVTLATVAADHRLPDLRTLLVGGEACPPALATAWGVEARVARQFGNAYGPTEVSVWSTCWTADRDAAIGDVVPIGGPVANTRLYVLDSALRLVPVGVPGELYIGGVGLARGYVNRPGLTAERFVPDPFGAEHDLPGARLYRTGDRVRRRADGQLEFLGRIDFQVKVRGFRIELGEIEHALAAVPSIGECVVIAREDVPGDRRLVAYVVPRNGTRLEPGALAEQLGATLPQYMIPAAFVVLDALPSSPNGKVDRKALPAPTGARPELAEGYLAPRTDLEAALAGMWQEVLGVEQVGVTDDFFALGGHSLLATRIVARIRETFAIEVPLRALFEARTIGALAEHVEHAVAELVDELSDEEVERLLLDYAPDGGTPLPAVLHHAPPVVAGEVPSA
jgi:amino acid adenylation domain-containing protein